MVITLSISRICHFNSIKVRLKLGLLDMILLNFHLFQFHKGTIKTFIFLSSVPWDSPFQFHKGTIKTLGYLIAPTAEYHFNSIKVRLKLYNKDLIDSEKEFQFHKGTIKTGSGFRCCS